MRIMITMMTLLFTSALFAQKRDLSEKALQEIDSIIANPYEFLGKSDSKIIYNGRPPSIIGGDEWQAEVIPVNDKTKMGASQTVIIGTGCGVFMLIVSAKTDVVYTLTYLPHKKAKLNGAAILSHLSQKYSIGKSGDSVITTKDGSYIGLSILNGGILLVAFTADKKSLRFKDSL